MVFFYWWIPITRLMYLTVIVDLMLLLTRVLWFQLNARTSNSEVNQKKRLLGPLKRSRIPD